MRVLPVAAAVGLLGVAAAVFSTARHPGADPRAPNAPHFRPAFPGQTRAPAQKSAASFQIVTLTHGLEQPWGMAFLPDGRVLVTEKPGRLRLVSAAGALSAPVAGVPAVDSRGQGGLLDVAIDPDHAANHFVYVSYAEPRDAGRNNTAVARGRLVDGPTPALESVEVIYRQVPALASTMHFGSRLVFGRDGTLFVTQGERSILEGRRQAQQLDSLLGKIVRIDPDGSVPPDNPYVGRAGVHPKIYASGLRNVQAAALHPGTGELWEVEHGARGGDELNVVRSGKDYGWPTISYGIEYAGGLIGDGIQSKDGMEQPLYYWDPVIAPSGMTFYTGGLFPEWRGNLFVGAHGQGIGGLVRLVLEGERVLAEERLLTALRERVRDVRQGPDGALYLLTDGPNGKLLKLVPEP